MRCAALTFDLIGEAAKLEIAGSGVGFRRVSVPQAASPSLPHQRRSAWVEPHW